MVGSTDEPLLPTSARYPHSRRPGDLQKQIQLMLCLAEKKMNTRLFFFPLSLSPPILLKLHDYIIYTLLTRSSKTIFCPTEVKEILVRVTKRPLTLNLVLECLGWVSLYGRARSEKTLDDPLPCLRLDILTQTGDHLKRRSVCWMSRALPTSRCGPRTVWARRRAGQRRRRTASSWRGNTSKMWTLQLGPPREFAWNVA